MTDIITRAFLFAKAAHDGQKRKYTGDDYIVHPVRVSEKVRSIGGSKEMICAALLHDVIEDCGVKKDELIDLFGITIADLVDWLSDISKKEDGPRHVRKAIDRDHIARSPMEAQIIKCADMIDNSKSITVYDPGFAKVYMVEKELLLDVMLDEVKELDIWMEANEIVQDYKLNKNI